MVDIQFADWFKKFGMSQFPSNVNKYIQDLAKGPLLKVKTYHGYVVNGYRFHTITRGSRRATMNSGVCIKGEIYGTDEMNFYGRLLEVCVLEYPGLPIKSITLFKCEWFDPSPSGTSIHKDFGLVSINHKRRLSKFEPFVLANQANQVYYCSYPSMNQSKKDWWEVCKVKARSKIEIPNPLSSTRIIEQPPFQEDKLRMALMDCNPIIGDNIAVLHPNGGTVDIDDGDGYPSDENIIISDDECIENDDDDDDT